MEIRNIAIIAHVDHGKTTLVDAMLKQSHLFRDNQKEMTDVLLMDSNDLEKEKGITILSKNTAVTHDGNKINIIDTPGHADFGGEVERILNMASGALLLVDAAEGPLPQTRFVLKKALDAKLKVILVINKIDKKDARPDEVLREVETLFLETAEDEDALDFPILYAVGRDGKAFYELPENYTEEIPGDLEPIFKTIEKELPNVAGHDEEPFQMLISTLDADNYVGKICIGKVSRGTLNKGERVSLLEEDGKNIGTYAVTKLFTSMGLERLEVDKITSGDIVAIAGIPELTIGQTVTDINTLEPLPAIHVEDPTLQVSIGPNTSPFAGREGSFVTSRQIKARLDKEKETNLGLKIEEEESGSTFKVSGRGELHLSVLIETMRREGYELEVSKPQVIFKTIDGVKSEPYEEVTIDVDTEYMGAVSEELGKRKGIMLALTNHGAMTRLIYQIATRNLLGIRNVLLTKTRGTALLSSFLLGYKPAGGSMETLRNGALIAAEGGNTMIHGLLKGEERGVLFIGAAVPVYEGMVVGLSSREQDIEVNVCREKKLTNNRSSGEGVKEKLEPHVILSLEQFLDIVGDDELLEVTPKNIRLRKRYLSQSQRRIVGRKGQ